MKRHSCLIFSLLFLIAFVKISLGNNFVGFEAPNVYKGWSYGSMSSNYDYAYTGKVDFVNLNGRIYVLYEIEPLDFTGTSPIIFKGEWLISGFDPQNPSSGFEKFLGGDFDGDTWYGNYEYHGPKIYEVNGKLEIFYLNHGALLKTVYNPNNGIEETKIIDGIYDDNTAVNDFMAIGDKIYVITTSRFEGEYNGHSYYHAVVLLHYYDLSTGDKKAYKIFEGNFKLWSPGEYPNFKFMASLASYNGNAYLAFYLYNHNSVTGEEISKFRFAKISVQNNGIFLQNVEDIDDASSLFPVGPLKLSFDDNGNPAVLLCDNDFNSSNKYAYFYLKNNTGWQKSELEDNTEAVKNIKQLFYYNGSWFITLKSGLYKFENGNWNQVFATPSGGVLGVYPISGQEFFVFIGKGGLYKWSVSSGFSSALNWAFPRYWYDYTAKVKYFVSPEGKIYILNYLYRDADTKEFNFYEIYPYPADSRYFVVDKIGNAPYGSKYCTHKFLLLFDSQDNQYLVYAEPKNTVNSNCSSALDRAFVFKRNENGWENVSNDGIDLQGYSLSNEKQFAIMDESNKIHIFGRLQEDNIFGICDGQQKVYSLYSITFDPETGNTSYERRMSFCALRTFLADGNLIVVNYKDETNTYKLAVYSGSTKLYEESARVDIGNSFIKEIGSKVFLSYTITSGITKGYMLVKEGNNWRHVDEVCKDGNFVCQESDCADQIDNDGDGLINEKLFYGSCSDSIDNDGDGEIDEGYNYISDGIIKDITLVNGIPVMITRTNRVLFLPDGENKLYRAGFTATVISDEGLFRFKEGFYPKTAQHGPRIFLSPSLLDFGTSSVNFSWEHSIGFSPTLHEGCVLPFGYYYYPVNCNYLESSVVTDFNLSGNSEDFSFEEKTTSVNIIFNPQSEGYKEATLNISTTDPINPNITIALRGNTPNAVPPTYYSLEVMLPEHGTVKSPADGSDINCSPNGEACEKNYEQNAQVTLYAEPDNGYEFSHWTGDCSGCNSNSQCTIIMDSDKTCGAVFVSSQPPSGGRGGAANHPPSIDSFTASATFGIAPLSVHFRCVGHDPDGDEVRYTISVNGNGFNEDEVDYTFEESGVYTVTCTADDGKGGRKSKSVAVQVSPSVTLPLPERGEVYSSLIPVMNPFASGEASSCRPVAFSGFDRGVVDVKILVPKFESPVDIYLLIYAPAIDSENLYEVTYDGRIQSMSKGLVPWKRAVEEEVSEEPFGEIPLSLLPPGMYYIGVGVTPVEDLSKYYLWISYFMVRR